MGKTATSLIPEFSEFLLAQKLFFVASAPLAAEGHVNLSPKGLDGLRVLDPQRVAYIDYAGSGVETLAHLRENGRVVIMVCAFDGPPNILRIWGRGRGVEPQDPEFPELLACFEPVAPARSVIVVEIERAATSCGYGVPRFEYQGERDQIPRWARKKGEDGLTEYQIRKNAQSLDGLPGLRWVKP